MTLSAAETADLHRAVEYALLEDGAAHDWTSQLLPNRAVAAQIVCRDTAVICGQAWVQAVFAAVDRLHQSTAHDASAQTQLQWHCAEGAEVAAGTVVLTIHGLARHLVTAERCALNFLQSLSAIATKTRVYAQAVQGTSARVLDTRKTIPSLRLASKYAVRVGGGANQRINLADGILIKENHIAAAGGVPQVLAAARALNAGVPIQIEVETLTQLEQALSHGAVSVLLDNFSTDQLRQAVALNQGRALLEASGGVSLTTLREIALTGVDRISIGGLTKDIQAVDFSMRMVA